MKHYNGSQIDQNKVFEDSCHMSFALMVSAPKIILLQKSKVYYRVAGYTKSINNENQSISFYLQSY